MKPTSRRRWCVRRLYTKRTLDVSRAPGRAGGSHVLAYSDKSGGTEEYALYGTPDEITAGLEALRDAGAEYVLLTISGGVEQLNRFARDIMPAFAHSAPVGARRNDAALRWPTP